MAYTYISTWFKKENPFFTREFRGTPFPTHKPSPGLSIWGPPSGCAGAGRKVKVQRSSNSPWRVVMAGGTRWGPEAS